MIFKASALALTRCKLIAYLKAEEEYMAQLGVETVDDVKANEGDQTGSIRREFQPYFLARLEVLSLMDP